MSRFSKLLLMASLATLPVGLFVSITPAGIPPDWTTALPLSAILFGLFLIRFIFGDHLFNSDQDEIDSHRHAHG
jgi:hypothetical protein